MILQGKENLTSLLDIQLPSERLSEKRENNKITNKHLRPCRPSALVERATSRFAISSISRCSSCLVKFLVFCIVSFFFIAVNCYVLFVVLVFSPAENHLDTPELHTTLNLGSDILKLQSAQVDISEAVKQRLMVSEEERKEIKHRVRLLRCLLRSQLTRSLFTVTMVTSIHQDIDCFLSQEFPGYSS